MNSTSLFKTTALLGAALMTLWSSAAHAQSADEQNREILNELRQIRQLLEKLATPQPTGAPAAGDQKVKMGAVTGYELGRHDAPLTMIEFADLQCPYCRQFHVTTFDQLKKDYIDTGKVRYISRDFPLDTLHPQAMQAAVAARCAADQGHFWEMRHAILVNNQQLAAPDAFANLARELKLDAAQFKTCTADAARFKKEFEIDSTEGRNIGVSGTPTFVIGQATADGLDGVRIVGAQPYANFEAKLKELLAKQSGTH